MKYQQMGLCGRILRILGSEKWIDSSKDAINQYKRERYRSISLLLTMWPTNNLKKDLTKQCSRQWSFYCSYDQVRHLRKRPRTSPGSSTAIFHHLQMLISRSTHPFIRFSSFQTLLLDEIVRDNLHPPLDITPRKPSQHHVRPPHPEQYYHLHSRLHLLQVLQVSLRSGPSLPSSHFYCPEYPALSLHPCHPSLLPHHQPWCA